VPYAQAVYDSLIRRTVEDEYVPMLATAWEFSEDNRTITLTLRDDVTFSDGEALDAEAVKANFEHFAQAAGPLGNQLVGLAAVEVLGTHELSATFEAPIPDLEHNLSDAAGRIASPASLGSEGLKTVPVGTGPYVMDEGRTVQGSTYTLTAREDYWEPDLQKFDQVVFSIYTDETGLLNALKSGQVDVGNLTQQDNIDNASASGVEILNAAVPISWFGLALYDRDGSMVPELASPLVRQAIGHAIDIDAINQAAYNGAGTPNAQLLNPSSDAYDESLNSTYSYDPERARSLLAEAGYPDGFTLPMPAATGLLVPAAQTGIEQGLAEVGITVQWTTIPSQQLYAEMQAGKFAAAYVIFGSVPTEWSVVQNYLTETAAWNPFGATDPELQELIEAIPAADAEERIELFAQINRWEVENAWFIPWYWAEENFAKASETVTVEVQPRNNVPFLYNYAPAS
jgi:peptide/nickel transport system substrate-binding protein